MQERERAAWRAGRRIEGFKRGWAPGREASVGEREVFGGAAVRVRESERSVSDAPNAGGEERG